jgi:hypothetical protein
MDGISIAGVLGWKRAGPAQNPWEGAFHRSRKMHHDEDGPWVILWQATDKLRKHFDAAGGPAHNYYIPHYH